jgi:hypothetical protein
MRATDWWGTVTPEQYRLNGAECLKLARLAANPADKMLLLQNRSAG